MHWANARSSTNDARETGFNTQKDETRSVSLIMHKGQGLRHSDLKLLQENVRGGLHRHRGELAEDNFGSTKNKTTRKWNQTSCLSPDEWI